MTGSRPQTRTPGPLGQPHEMTEPIAPWIGEDSGRAPSPGASETLSHDDELLAVAALGAACTQVGPRRAHDVGGPGGRPARTAPRRVSR